MQWYKSKSNCFELFAQKKLYVIQLYGLMSFNYQNFVFLSKKYTDKPSPFDAEMLFNIGAGYRFSGLWYCKGWELSAKFRYTCGILYTHFNGSRKLYFKQYNTEIFYDFRAFDLRMNKRWHFRGYTCVFYFDAQNITNR